MLERRLNFADYLLEKFKNCVDFLERKYISEILWDLFSRVAWFYRTILFCFHSRLVFVIKGKGKEYCIIRVYISAYVYFYFVIRGELARPRFEYVKIMYEPRGKIRDSRVFSDGGESRKQRRVPRNYDDGPKSRRWNVTYRTATYEANLINHESI